MPRIAIESLPDDARAWVFASHRPLAAEEEARLLDAVDEHLEGWAAHGTPLYSGRELRDRRFLIVAVDERRAGASGCSIDGLYRALRRVEGELGTSLTAGGQVFVRTAQGEVNAMSRADFIAAAGDGQVTASTRVFDTALTSLGAARSAFETEAGRSWHASLLGAGAGAR